MPTADSRCQQPTAGMTATGTSLQTYLEREILPAYDHFDLAHRRDHALDVINRSMALARHYDVNLDMVLAIAAFHDAGLIEGRDTHHLASGKMVRHDKRLAEWFDAEQIETMAQAVEDHRASLGHEPRSIYGKIVAEADRLISPQKVIERTLQYGLGHYPSLDKEGHYQRFREHLLDKYSESGYMKLWIPESENATGLEELRAIINDENKLRHAFDAIWKG